MLGIRQLQQFIAVAEEGNFHRAARRLQMSQPPLTQAIKRLERSLQVRLLDRSHRRVQLTAAGAVLLEEARRVTQLVHAASERVRRAADGTEGLLRLAFVQSAALSIVPVAVRAFRRARPEVQIELTSETTAMQIQGLRARRIDAGFLVPPARDLSPDLALMPVWREPLVVALPADHALAAADKIRLDFLASEPFVLLPLSQGPAFLRTILSACLSAGFFPRVVHEAPQLQTAIGLVACGLGVSIVPAAMRAIRHEAVRFVDIDADEPPSYELAIAYMRNGSNPVVSEFVKVARALAAHTASCDGRGDRAVNWPREGNSTAATSITVASEPNTTKR